MCYQEISPRGLEGVGATAMRDQRSVTATLSCLYYGEHLSPVIVLNIVALIEVVLDHSFGLQERRHRFDVVLE